jgi:hypothetical protein
MIRRGAARKRVSGYAIELKRKVEVPAGAGEGFLTKFPPALLRSALEPLACDRDFV